VVVLGTGLIFDLALVEDFVHERLDLTLLHRTRRADEEVAEETDEREPRHERNAERLIPKRLRAKEDIPRRIEEEENQRGTSGEEEELEETQRRILREERRPGTEEHRQRRHRKMREEPLHVRVAATLDDNVHDGPKERQHGE
jgi:hypothetical protein